MTIKNEKIKKEVARKTRQLINDKKTLKEVLLSIKNEGVILNKKELFELLKECYTEKTYQDLVSKLSYNEGLNLNLVQKESEEERLKNNAKIKKIVFDTSYLLEMTIDSVRFLLLNKDFYIPDIVFLEIQKLQQDPETTFRAQDLISLFKEKKVKYCKTDGSLDVGFDFKKDNDRLILTSCKIFSMEGFDTYILTNDNLLEIKAEAIGIKNYVMSKYELNHITYVDDDLYDLSQLSIEVRTEAKFNNFTLEFKYKRNSYYLKNSSIENRENGLFIRIVNQKSNTRGIKKIDDVPYNQFESDDVILAFRKVGDKSVQMYVVKRDNQSEDFKLILDESPIIKESGISKCNNVYKPVINTALKTLLASYR